MQILIVNFQLAGMTHDELEAVATEHGPVFGGQVPGLYEKVFLSDPATGTYGGVYKFVDRAALDAYLGGEIWAGVKASPHFVNLSALTFGVIEAPTRAAHGYPAVAVA